MSALSLFVRYISGLSIKTSKINDHVSMRAPKLLDTAFNNGFRGLCVTVVDYKQSNMISKSETLHGKHGSDF